MNGLINNLTHNLGLAWPRGIKSQCAIFFNFGFDLIVSNKDIF
jgi:hypothetical protein